MMTINCEFVLCLNLLLLLIVFRQRSFRLNNEPLCYDNGLPVAELDGSVHDIFQEDAGNTNGLTRHYSTK